MVGAAQSELLSEISTCLKLESTIQAVVLFGSRARERGAAAADVWSDFDLQVVTSSPRRLITADWSSMTKQELCMQVLRPATSGVHKLTLLFSAGEIDVVIVPEWQLRLARLALTLGLHRKISRVSAALNNLSTIMGGGYQMLKGDRKWGAFYARVVAEVPGFRLSDRELVELAEIFACDFHWVLQKLQRGELVASQRILHRYLLETNIVLRHEARLRAGGPTFQQARRVEKLLSPEELWTVQGSARLDQRELFRAAFAAFSGLEALMRELVPNWKLPPAMQALLAPFRRHLD